MALEKNSAEEFADAMELFRSSEDPECQKLFETLSELQTIDGLVSTSSLIQQERKASILSTISERDSEAESYLSTESMEQDEPASRSVSESDNESRSTVENGGELGDDEELKKTSGRLTGPDESLVNNQPSVSNETESDKISVPETSPAVSNEVSEFGQPTASGEPPESDKGLAEIDYSPTSSVKDQVRELEEKLKSMKPVRRPTPLVIPENRLQTDSKSPLLNEFDVDQDGVKKMTTGFNFRRLYPDWEVDVFGVDYDYDTDENRQNRQTSEWDNDSTDGFMDCFHSAVYACSIF